MEKSNESGIKRESFTIGIYLRDKSYGRVGSMVSVTCVLDCFGFIFRIDYKKYPSITMDRSLFQKYLGLLKISKILMNFKKYLNISL